MRKTKLNHKNGHVALGKIESAIAAAESCVIDAADDRSWFQANPTKNERQRLASFGEREATGLPLGTLVQVIRLPGGAQARTFLEPEPNLN